MIDLLSKAVETWNDRQCFSGVISIGSADETLFRQSFGYRQRAEKLPNNEDTAFGIASGTKLFTGLACCKQHGDEHLSSFAPLYRHHVRN